MFLLSTIGGACIVVFWEIALWSLFKKRITGMIFPKEADASYFRFFTMARMRLVAIIHTIVLLVIVELLLFFVW